MNTGRREFQETDFKLIFVFMKSKEFFYSLDYYFYFCKSLRLELLFSSMK